MVWGFTVRIRWFGWLVPLRFLGVDVHAGEMISMLDALIDGVECSALFGVYDSRSRMKGSKRVAYKNHSLYCS